MSALPVWLASTGRRYRNHARIIRDAADVGPDTNVEVRNDSIPALAGAFGELRGILLIAGTGSIAVGADGAGRIIRSGGWGHILGDEGSAYWVGLRALNAATRFHDRRSPQTDLLGRALAYFGEKEPFSLIPAVYEPFDKSKIAAFARIVAEERDRGDEVAEQIFKDASEELALLVISVATRLGEAQAGGRIAFAGGFLANNERLWHDTEARILAVLPRHRIVCQRQTRRTAPVCSRSSMPAKKPQLERPATGTSTKFRCSPDIRGDGNDGAYDLQWLSRSPKPTYEAAPTQQESG